MRRHDKKSSMNLASKQSNQQSERDDSKSFYSKVWEGATTLITNASSDVSTIFSKNQPKSDSTLSSTYNSERIKNLKGNWHIIVPRSDKKTSSR